MGRREWLGELRILVRIVPAQQPPALRCEPTFVRSGRGGELFSSLASAIIPVWIGTSWRL